MDKMVYTTLQQVILEIRDPKAAEDARNAVLEAAKSNAQMDEDGVDQAQESEGNKENENHAESHPQQDNDIISRELAMFREKAEEVKDRSVSSKVEGNDSDNEVRKPSRRTSRSQSPSLKTRSTDTRESERDNRGQSNKDRERDSGRKNSRYRDDRDRDSKHADDEEEDEEAAERKREERRAKEIEIAYKEVC
jgi:RNA-binding protein 25